MDLPFKCGDCSRSFNLEQSLVAHVNFRHKKKFLCKNCDDIFNSDVELVRHRLENHKEDIKERIKSTRHAQTNDAPSEELIQSFVSRTISQRNRKPMYACKECKFECVTANSIKRHVTIKHLRVKCYECSICDSSFLHRPSLVEHNLKVHGIKTLNNKEKRERFLETAAQFVAYDSDKNPTSQCTKCDKDYGTYDKLLVHIQRVHVTMASTSICDMCGKVCKNGGILREHRMTAHGIGDEKKARKLRMMDEYFDGFVDNKAGIKCKKCQVVLRGGSFHYLRRHVEYIHEKGDREYHCEKCGETFHHKYTLKAHMKRKHKVDWSQVCVPEEGEEADIKILIKQLFIEAEHNGKTRVKCVECDKLYNPKYNKREHVRRFHLNKSHICNQCGIEVASADLLVEHESNQHAEDKGEVCAQEILAVADDDFLMEDEVTETSPIEDSEAYLIQSDPEESKNVRHKEDHAEENLKQDFEEAGKPEKDLSISASVSLIEENKIKEEPTQDPLEIVKVEAISDHEYSEAEVKEDSETEVKGDKEDSETEVQEDSETEVKVEEAPKKRKDFTRKLTAEEKATAKKYTIRTSEKLFECKICAKVKANIAMGHILRHIVSQHLTCDICKESLVDTTYSEHLESVHKLTTEKAHELRSDESSPLVPFVGENNTCKECLTQKKSFCHLKTHIIQHHLPAVPFFKCTICNLKYYSPRCYDSHVERFHAKAKPKTKEETLLQNFLQEHFGCIDRSKDKSELFRCKICERHFLTEHHAVRHLHMKHHIFFTGGSHVCDTCGLSFIKLSLFTAHIKTHQKKTKCSVDESLKKVNHMWQCKECDQQFLKKDPLRRHFIIDHLKVTPDICDVCGESFTKTGLDTHKRAQHSIKKAAKKTLSTMELDNAIRLLQDGLKCLKCTRVFKTEERVQKHIKNFHVRQPEISCDFCEAKFVSINSKIHHMVKVHEVKSQDNLLKENEEADEKLKQLEFVKKNIAEAKQFEENGVTFFECPLCKKVVTNKQGLRIHLRQVHLQIKYLECEHCRKRFSSTGTMAYHTKFIHGSKNERSRHLEIIREVTKEAKTIVKDGQTTLYECAKCNKFLKGKQGLRLHYMSIHIK